MTTATAPVAAVVVAARALADALNPWYGELFVVVREEPAGATEAIVPGAASDLDAAAIAAALRAVPPATLGDVQGVWRALEPALPRRYRDTRPWSAVTLSEGLVGALREHLRFTQRAPCEEPLAVFGRLLEALGCRLRGALSLMSASSTPISVALAATDAADVAVLAVYAGDGV